MAGRSFCIAAQVPNAGLAVTPSDSTILPGSTTGIFAQGAGTVILEYWGRDGSAAYHQVTRTLPVNTYVRGNFRRILAASTATGITLDFLSDS